MSFLYRFFHRPVEEKKPRKPEKEDLLKKACEACVVNNQFKEIYYEDLSQSLFTNPLVALSSLASELKIPEEDPNKVIQCAIELARDYKNKGDFELARYLYRIVGSLALWIGEVGTVKEAFNEIAVISKNIPGEYPTYPAIRKDPQKAIEIAKKYYELLEKSR